MRERHLDVVARHVEVLRRRFPTWWPPGCGDLVVWSELAYYLTGAGATLALSGLERWLEPNGELMAVHYLGETNYPRRGVDIAPWLDAVPFLRRVAAHRDERFDLGVWRRVTR